MRITICLVIFNSCLLGLVECQTAKTPTTKPSTARMPTTTLRTTTVFRTTPKNACLSRPCQNRGNCTSLPGGGYKCTCGPYFTGVNCENDIFHPCRSRPCLNGARCIETGNCTQEHRCVCLHGFTGKRCETKVETLTLNMTAKETLSAVYVDGVEVEFLENANDWRKVASLRVPVTTRLIAVIGVNIHDKCAGIMLSESNDYVISGSVNWKCNIDATHGWADLAYNDTKWPVAHVVGQNGVVPGCPNMTEVKGIRSEAKWIWTTHHIQQDLVVYCRGYIDVCKSKPCQNGGTCHRSGPRLCNCIDGYSGQFCERVTRSLLRITANDKLDELYIDGVRMSASSAGEIYGFHLDPITRQVTVMASDFHNPSPLRQCFGILASSPGPVAIQTSSLNWKCSASPAAGWFKLDHDDSKWLRPSSLQHNNQSRCPEVSPVPEISPEARWIWNSPAPQWDVVSFCRGYTDLCSKNVKICQNGGKCNQNTPDLCSCPKGFAGKFCEFKIGVDAPGPDATCPSDQ